MSKRQDCVESATYGSEVVAARLATEQIMDLRTTLRYMGVPVVGHTYMFGDNKSVITSSTIPHSAMKKRHNFLAFSRVREAIAMGMINFIHCFSPHNPADVLTKSMGHGPMYALIKPFLFYNKSY